MKDHPPPEATSQQAFLDDPHRRAIQRRIADDGFRGAVGHLRSLKFTGSAEDLAIVEELIDWLEAVDIGSLGPRAEETLLTFAETYDAACEAEAAKFPARAIAFVWDVTIKMLLAAKTRHEIETGQIDTSERRMSREEFHHKHIAPLYAEARRVERSLRGHRRVPQRHTGRRTRGCTRARRTGARRAAGVRSGSDPGDPDSEPPRRRGNLRHVSIPLAAFLRGTGGAL
jgi:hypothetical protein